MKKKTQNQNKTKQKETNKQRKNKQTKTSKQTNKQTRKSAPAFFFYFSQIILFLSRPHATCSAATAFEWSSEEPKWFLQDLEENIEV